MAEELRGQVALVTGGAKRLGRAIALALAAEGVHVAIHYHASAGDAEALSAEIAALGVQAWTLPAAFDRPEEYETLIARTLDAAGDLHLLVNNAGIFPRETMADVTLASLCTNLEINAWAPYVLTRAFAKRPGRGKVLNLLDTRLSGYDWQHVGYIWSKHMLAVMTRMAAFQYAPDVTVNAVAPGLILPPPGMDDSYLQALVGTVPLGRHGSAADIAEAALFLLKSTFITGETLHVDGGRHLREGAGGQHSH